jgi:septal ring factor EnvC (AmiA/AmiB activator)
MNNLFRFAAMFFLAALATAAAAAQSANPDAATMQEILSEVRQLRRTLEKTISLGPRMQILLQRAQFQEQKASRISQQLDDVRKLIAEQTARQTAANDRLAKIEQDISAESDAARRAQLEDMRAGLKMVAGNGPDQQLRARESELSNSLETEQAALNDLNEKLDALERQLEAVAAPR